jgi:hypothetical protein
MQKGGLFAVGRELVGEDRGKSENDGGKVSVIKLHYMYMKVIMKLIKFFTLGE